MALNTMELLYRTEIERLAFSHPPASTTAQQQVELLSSEEVHDRFSQGQLERFTAIFDSYQRQGGTTRDKYMDRLELEFRLDGLQRSDLDILDKFYQNKRWQRQKEKALLRDWKREKIELKEKTIKFIEEIVEETSAKLKQEYEMMKMDRVKNEMHYNLDEKRQEYMHKMEIISEIKQEQKYRQEQEQKQKLKLDQKYADMQKEFAQKYKVDKVNTSKINKEKQFKEE